MLLAQNYTAALVRPTKKAYFEHIYRNADEKLHHLHVYVVEIKNNEAQVKEILDKKYGSESKRFTIKKNVPMQ